MRNEDIVMILFKSLPTTYENLIVVLETMLTKELMMEYMMTHLMYGMSKHKEK